MKKNILFTFLVLSIASCSPINTENTLTSVAECKQEQALCSKVDNIMNMFSDSGFVGVVLIGDPDKIILNKEYGKSKIPLDSSTAFWIASNTKPMTAIAVMKLVEEGKLSVKDTLPQFFKNVPSDKVRITVEHLLTHSSGLPSEFISEGEQSGEKAIAKILSQKLLCRPGEKENYSNDGYDLLGKIVELRSGRKYQDYLRETIFNKAGMSNSNFFGDTTIVVDPPNDSITYQPFYKKIFKDGKPRSDLALIGSGGICSNTADLYKMMNALKNGQILNQTSLTDLFKPRTEIESKGDTVLSWAYGWVIQTIGKETEIRHSGRSDWNHNSRIFFLNNGYRVILWARDYGPNKKAWATEASIPLTQQLNKMK